MNDQRKVGVNRCGYRKWVGWSDVGGWGSGSFSTFPPIFRAEDGLSHRVKLCGEQALKLCCPPPELPKAKIEVLIIFVTECCAIVFASFELLQGVVDLFPLLFFIPPSLRFFHPPASSRWRDKPSYDINLFSFLHVPVAPSSNENNTMTQDQVADPKKTVGERRTYWRRSGQRKQGQPFWRQPGSGWWGRVWRRGQRETWCRYVLWCVRGGRVGSGQVKKERKKERKRRRGKKRKKRRRPKTAKSQCSKEETKKCTAQNALIRHENNTFSRNKVQFFFFFWHGGMDSVSVSVRRINGHGSNQPTNQTTARKQKARRESQTERASTGAAFTYSLSVWNERVCPALLALVLHYPHQNTKTRWIFGEPCASCTQCLIGWLALCSGSYVCYPQVRQGAHVFLFDLSFFLF